MTVTLDEINWATITPRQAKNLRPAAARRYKATAERFNRFEVTEEELTRASLLEESLDVFILTGSRPGIDHCERCGGTERPCKCERDGRATRWARERGAA